MDNINSLKIALLSAVGLLSSATAQLFGGYDAFLEALIALMAIDFISGIIVAIAFKRSAKTESGRLSSAAGFKGLMKKCCMLLMVVVAVLLDGLIHADGLTRDAVIIAFVLNELISILENMGLMGIKMPDALTNALELLGKKNKA